MRRSVPAVLAVAGLLLLAGCSASSNPTSVAQSCAKLSNGSASDGVKVTGKAGAEPTVKIDTPLKSDKIERTVLSAGDGAKATENKGVDMAIAVYNGRTGKSLGTQGWGSTQALALTVGAETYPVGFSDAVKCLPEGSRAVLAGPAADALGASTLSQLKLKKTDSIVVVADVQKVFDTKATGKAQSAPEGFPTVKLAASGKPTITMPTTAAPTETQVADLKKGSGATVKNGDTVTVQYQGAIYSTGKVFDQSWGRGITQFPTSGTIAGFTKALVGQKVGSQVIAVIPPADGYGDTGTQDGTIKGTDTLVFVIDILDTQAAATTGQ